MARSWASCPASTRMRQTSGSTSPYRPVSAKGATCWSCGARGWSSRSAGRGGRSPRLRSPAGWTSRSSACAAGPSPVLLPTTASSRWRPPRRRSGQLLLGFLRRLASGAPGAVRHRLAPSGVGDGHEQPAEQAEVADEQPALHLLLLLVLLGPERVARGGVRHDGQRKRPSGQPRHPPGGEQEPGADLRAGHRLGDGRRIAETERTGQRLRLPATAVALPERLDTGGDEGGSEQWSGESTKHVRSREEVGSPLSSPHTRQILTRRWPRGPLFARVGKCRTDPRRTSRRYSPSGSRCAGSTTGARVRPAQSVSRTRNISCCSPSRDTTTTAGRRSAKRRGTSSCDTTARSSWSTGRRPVASSSAAATRATHGWCD